MENALYKMKMIPLMDACIGLRPIGYTLEINPVEQFSGRSLTMIV